MRGGHSTSHSAEFYGGDSGSYYTNPPVAGGSAYGQIRPVSFGTIVGGETGPNLAVYPNGSPIQTGGQGCGYRGSSSQSGGTNCDSHSLKQKNQFGGQGCPYRKSQSGGTSCNSHSQKQKNQLGGTYGLFKGGCDGCGCTPKPKAPRGRAPRARRSGTRGRRKGNPRSRRQRGGNHCSGSHSKPRSRTRTGRGREQSRRRPASRGRGRARRASQYKRHHTA